MRLWPLLDFCAVGMVLIALLQLPSSKSNISSHACVCQDIMTKEIPITARAKLCLRNASDYHHLTRGLNSDGRECRSGSLGNALFVSHMKGNCMRSTRTHRRSCNTLWAVACVPALATEALILLCYESIAHNWRK